VCPGVRHDQPAKRKYPEQKLQIGVAYHFKKLEAEKGGFTFFCVPNGVPRDKREASLFKALGVRPGVHDLVFLLTGGKTVLIELKAQDGRLSEDQKTFHALADSLGHRSYTVTASDATEGINIVYGILAENGWVRP
jgi:hypothetical protein